LEEIRSRIAFPCKKNKANKAIFIKEEKGFKGTCLVRKKTTTPKEKIDKNAKILFQAKVGVKRLGNVVSVIPLLN